MASKDPEYVLSYSEINNLLHSESSGDFHFNQIYLSHKATHLVCLKKYPLVKFRNRRTQAKISSEQIYKVKEFEK